MRKNQYEAHKLFYQGLSMLGNPKKVDKAISNIKKSYKLGSPLALFEIGMILRRTDLRDYPQNLEKSDKCLKEAKPILEKNLDGALDGDLATHFLAQYYLYGYANVEIDEAYGISLEEKVAKNGLVEATEFLIKYYSDPSHSNEDKVDFYTRLLQEQKAILASGQRSGVIEMLQTNEEQPAGKTVEDTISNIEEKKETEEVKETTEEVSLETISTQTALDEVENDEKEVEPEVKNIAEVKTDEEVEVQDEPEVQLETIDTTEETVNEIETEPVEEELSVKEVEKEEVQEERKPLPKKGKDPEFDYRKFIPTFQNQPQEVEAIIIDKKEEELPFKLDLTDKTVDSGDVSLLSYELYKPRERVTLVRPLYSKEERSPEHIANQQILKALNRLEENDSESLHDAIQLLGEASKVYPAKCNSLLGDIYSEGKYTEVNELLALHYFKIADSAGSVYASYRLGQLYLKENSESYDKDLGIKFIRKAAAAGYGPALDRMGKVYHNGEISLVSYQAAYSFYNLAVERNHRESYLSMAKIDDARGNDALAKKHRDLAQ